MTPDELNALTKAQLIARIVELDPDAKPGDLDRLTKPVLVERALALAPQEPAPVEPSPTEKDLLIEDTDAEKLAIAAAALTALQTRADAAEAALATAQERIDALTAELWDALQPGESFELRPEELAIRRNIGTALKYAAENDPGTSVAAIPILRALADRIAA